MPTKKQQESTYKSIIATIRKIAEQKGKVLELVEDGLGIGDFAHFPPGIKSDLHIRSPYESGGVLSRDPLHSNERVKISNLIDHIDLWIGLLSVFANNIDIDKIQTSGIGRNAAQGFTSK